MRRALSRSDTESGAYRLVLVTAQVGLFLFY